MGIINVVPFEISLQLCNEVGAHPYFVAPFNSLDKATDFMAELAQYCKTWGAANAPWMIPRFEGPNETWNGGSFTTALATQRALAHWGGTADFRDGYGKCMANLGQMCGAVYGVPDLGHTYHVLCGVHSAGGGPENDERIASNLYVAQAAAADPAITGSFGTISLTKQAAKLDLPRHISLVCSTSVHQSVIITLNCRMGSPTLSPTRATRRGKRRLRTHIAICCLALPHRLIWRA